MKMFDTKILSCDTLSPAVEALQSGEVVGLPTETVYGLAGNALSNEAVSKIFAAKGRPSDNPLIVHIATLEEIKPLVSNFPKDAALLADAFWPGPLTIILPKSEKIPAKTSGGLDTVAIRMPRHPIMQEMIQACGFPLAAPSANRSGAPSPTTALHVFDDLKGRVPYIVDGGPCSIGVESTVLYLVGEEPLLLRPGAISPEEISAVLNKSVVIHGNLLHIMAEDVSAPSPGMKYQHYAPTMPLTLFFGSSEDYSGRLMETNWGALCFKEDIPYLETIPALSYGHEDNLAEQSAQLFAMLRMVDTLPVEQVLVHASSSPDALSILNRLLRSAAFRIEGTIPEFLERK